MESQPKQNVSEGEKKIAGYAGRIRNGESEDSVLSGLPDSWIVAVRKELASGTGPAGMPTQQSAGVDTQSVDVRGTPTVLPKSERIKLSGWSASYELAKVAQYEGVDLSSLTREQYVQYAITNSLAIEDTQLRVAPWQRMITSPEAINVVVKEIREGITPENDALFHQFEYSMKMKASTDSRYLSEGVRVRQGTKDSDSWLFFAVNTGTGDEQEKTHKAYFYFKDLNTLTPEHFVNFMKHLKEHGFNGDVKIFQELASQGIRLNDQIVVHGASEHDAAMAEVLGQQFFATELADTGVGTDEIIDGKNMSYSEILAKRIAEAIKKS